MEKQNERLIKNQAVERQVLETASNSNIGVQELNAANSRDKPIQITSSTNTSGKLFSPVKANKINKAEIPMANIETQTTRKQYSSTEAVAQQFDLTAGDLVTDIEMEYENMQSDVTRKAKN